jgi:hypothetical protein
MSNRETIEDLLDEANGYDRQFMVLVTEMFRKWVVKEITSDAFHDMFSKATHQHRNRSTLHILAAVEATARLQGSSVSRALTAMMRDTIAFDRSLTSSLEMMLEVFEIDHEKILASDDPMRALQRPRMGRR